jgi:RNA polymerase sigma-70 factor (ECF subfamily)
VPAPGGEHTEFGSFTALLTAARAGSRDALGQALEGCRQYLCVVAQHALGRELRAKVGESDLVQETLLQAQQQFRCFDGANEAQLLAWLRAILLNRVTDCARRFDADMRAVEREVPLNGNSNHAGAANVPAPGPSPSEAFLALERDAALHQALAELPEHYRQVVLLHNRDGLTFEEVGRQTGQTAEAARKVWVRALRQLRLLLERSHGTDST